MLLSHHALLLTTVFPAIFTVAGMALGLGTVITVVFHFFHVDVDPREAELLEIMPGANCGGCGYSGCQGYAAALATGKDTVLTRCTAGGQETAEEIAHYFGQVPGEFIPTVARVRCQGCHEHIHIRFQYSGGHSCRTAKGLFSGPGSCAFGCLGYGDCERSCEYDAIQMVNGLAVIDPVKCVACGACERACPQSLITMTPKYENLFLVACSNPLPGPKVRDNCDIGCIGCTMCVRKCPVKAISMHEKLAVIDQDLCTHCGECAKVCPTKAITEGLKGISMALAKEA